MMQDSLKGAPIRPFGYTRNEPLELPLRDIVCTFAVGLVVDWEFRNRVVCSCDKYRGRTVFATPRRRVNNTIKRFLT